MEINLNEWFIEREVKFCPTHFKMSSVPLDEEKYHWVTENLNGRYYYGTISASKQGWDTNWFSDFIAFEDPRDLTMYELRWS